MPDRVDPRELQAPRAIDDVSDRHCRYGDCSDELHRPRSIGCIYPECLVPKPITIARCPVHGLHGQRTECYECGGPVEQVPMVPILALGPRDAEIARLKEEVSTVTRWALLANTAAWGVIHSLYDAG